MSSLQDQYDEAMFDFSKGDYDTAIAKLQTLLAQDSSHFDAQLALGMAHYRKGDYAAAIAAGLARGPHGRRGGGARTAGPRGGARAAQRAGCEQVSGPRLDGGPLRATGLGPGWPGRA